MTRIIQLIILTVPLSLLLSCQPESESSKPAALSTPAGMNEYLRNLPAVKRTQEWHNKYADGITIYTEHYQIHTTLLDPLMLRQVPAFMESAYKAYQSQLPSPIETRTIFTVYLFADRSQWEDFTKTFAAPNHNIYMKIKKGAYYLNGACVAYNIGRTRTFSVLAHEGWHQFNSKHFMYRLPSWLDEGVATLFEASTYEKGNFKFQPDRNGGRLGSLRKSLLTENMIPLKKLITLNPGQVVHDSDSVMAFYSQSYALVRLLREERYGRRLRKYHNMLLGWLRGNWPLESSLRRMAADRNVPLTVGWNSYVSARIFELYIQEDPELLEKEYLAFCRKIVYHVRLKKQP